MKVNADLLPGKHRLEKAILDELDDARFAAVQMSEQLVEKHELGHGGENRPAREVSLEEARGRGQSGPKQTMLRRELEDLEVAHLPHPARRCIPAQGIMPDR